MTPFFVAVTNPDWFFFLKTIKAREANFWLPSTLGFRALKPGQHLLFKLKSPHNKIAGGGIFLDYKRFSIAQAWALFDKANGAVSMNALRQNMFGARWESKSSPHSQIGAVLLESTCFFESKDWIDIPSWKPNIVRGKTYRSSSNEEERHIWKRYLNLRRAYHPTQSLQVPLLVGEPTFGTAYLKRPRIGQKMFRAQVLQAYENRCAVTSEHTPLVLQAAHIKPYSKGGLHSINNGLLLRSDLHTLFDNGYLTIRPEDHTLKVSGALEAHFANGVRYKKRDGEHVHLPQNPDFHPDPQMLDWHNKNVFLSD